MFVKMDIVANKTAKARTAEMTMVVAESVTGHVQMARLVAMEYVVRVKIIIAKVLKGLANAFLTAQVRHVAMMDVAIVAELVRMVNIAKMESVAHVKAYVLQQ
jgi:hypothetical protein